jgi:hypothetical protein
MIRRAAISAYCILLALSAAHAARADDKAACVAASEEGQSLRDQGRLKDARDKFAACASNACPGAVRKDCAEWLAGVEDTLPSVVIAVVDAEERDIVRVRVTLDGKPLAESLDGRAITLDPGPHTLRLDADGTRGVEVSFLAREGERRRVVSARLPRPPGPRAEGAPPRPPPAPARRPPPVAPIVVGSVGLAALGTFAVLGAVGEGEVSNLRQTCGVHHACAPVAVDTARNKLLAADVSLGVGLGAAAVAGGLFIAHFRTAARPMGPRVDVAIGARSMALVGRF